MITLDASDFKLELIHFVVYLTDADVILNFFGFHELFSSLITSVYNESLEREFDFLNDLA